MSTCHYCGESGDLRPYGPRGSMVCFPCAMSTKDREAETGKNFMAQVDASGDLVLLDGTEAGPYPIKHNPEAAALAGGSSDE